MRPTAHERTGPMSGYDDFFRPEPGERPSAVALPPELSPRQQSPRPSGPNYRRILSWIAGITSLILLGVSGIGYTALNNYTGKIKKQDVFAGLDRPDAAPEAGKDVAMQIAAMNPLAVDADSIPAAIVERERAIVVDTMKEDPKMAGKPDEMVAKIAEGKLNAFFKENTLLAQAFVKDSSITVEAYLKTAGNVTVTEFKRVALG